MENVRNLVINWLIKNSAISEENHELYEYAVYSAELLVLPVIMAIVIGWLSGSPVNGVLLIIPFMFLKKYSGGYNIMWAVISGMRAGESAGKRIKDDQN